MHISNEVFVKMRKTNLWEPATFGYVSILVEIGNRRDDQGVGFLSVPTDCTIAKIFVEERVDMHFPSRED